MKEIYAIRDNFLLVQERESTKGSRGRTIIRGSGYTITAKALQQNWVLTQFQTVPHMNRTHLPDPFILPQKLAEVYDEMDCNVFNVYFTPECNGLQDAIEECAKYLDKYFYPTYTRHAMIMHSKGALFATGLTKYLETNTNIAFITPTFGTIMGDEYFVYQEMDKYVDSLEGKGKKLAELQAAFLKRITHITCSRRPIDYDMYIGSDFLSGLDLSNLIRHKTLLVTAECPEQVSMNDMLFQYYAKFVGLEKNADGMVPLSNQRLIKKLVDEVVHIKATHPTALGKAMELPCIRKFIANI